MTDPQPSWRKPAAIAAILLLILIWAVLVALSGPLLNRLPWAIQALFYLFVGIAWIAPLGPLLRWSETGRWRKARRGSD